jgi:hypothetical protein
MVLDWMMGTAAGGVFFFFSVLERCVAMTAFRLFFDREHFCPDVGHAWFLYPVYVRIVSPGQAEYRFLPDA